MANRVGIREYINQARDANGNVLPTGEEPAIAATTILATGTSAQHTFNAKARFFQIRTEDGINFAITANGNPTAIVEGAGRIPPNTLEFFGLASGGKTDAGVATPLKIAIIIDA